MKTIFKEKKATDAAALLLKYNNGKMNYMKLIKLLYLADREALIKWGRPITYSHLVSMKHGPVLGDILDLINYDSKGIWHSHISSPTNYQIEILKEPSYKSLSDVELKLLDEIFKRYKNKNEWDMIKITYDLPEWIGSFIQIDIRDILNTTDKTDIEKHAIISELEEKYKVERIRKRLEN